jgi:hypothetical protein
MELKLERGLFLFLAVQLLAVTQAQRRVIGKTKTVTYLCKNGTATKRSITQRLCYST